MIRIRQIKINLDSKQDIKDKVSKLLHINVDEIKKYAQMMQGVNEEALTDDDIKYGLSYGRSVIVEYLA